MSHDRQGLLVESLRRLEEKERAGAMPPQAQQWSDWIPFPKEGPCPIPWAKAGDYEVLSDGGSEFKPPMSAREFHWGKRGFTWIHAYRHIIRPTEAEGEGVAASDDGWMPIETAPKPGEWVLIYAHDPGVVDIGAYDGECDLWFGSRWTWGFECQPTHWRHIPLPPPPGTPAEPSPSLVEAAEAMAAAAKRMAKALTMIRSSFLVQKGAPRLMCEIDAALALYRTTTSSKEG